MPNRFVDEDDLTSLCHLEDIPPGGARGFEDLRIFAVRSENQLFVYHDVCPHYGRTQLAWRKHEYLSGDGNAIVCSAHGAEFEIFSGKCTVGPCLGQSLEPVPHKIRDGQIYVSQKALVESGYSKPKADNNRG